VKRGKVNLKKLKARYKGLHEHRLKDNPLEAQIIAAWQQANLDAMGPYTSDLLKHILGDAHHGHVPLLLARRVATALQWLGSPVGFAWLVDTLGLEVVREMQLRSSGGQTVEPGQIYRQVKGGRRVVVEKRRYGHGSFLFILGPNTHWTVRNELTGRRSYIRERILLDESKWVRMNEIA
jgi:hypothetical protein